MTKSRSNLRKVFTPLAIGFATVCACAAILLAVIGFTQVVVIVICAFSILMFIVSVDTAIGNFLDR